ncbi:MAG: hypothetical protein K2G16_09135, partial [Lachnospiraceae bacterium]|nr:hypothetical protein [Lachnospiraceae bacterium]
MNGLQKRNKRTQKAGRRYGLSRFLGICLSVLLFLSDSLPAYAAAGAGISAGDGIRWEAGEGGAPESDSSSESGSASAGDGSSESGSVSAGNSSSESGSASAGDGSVSAGGGSSEDGS